MASIRIGNAMINHNPVNDFMRHFTLPISNCPDMYGLTYTCNKYRTTASCHLLLFYFGLLTEPPYYWGHNCDHPYYPLGMNVAFINI